MTSRNDVQRSVKRLVDELLGRTVSGTVRWSETDIEDEYLCTDSDLSVLIRKLQTAAYEIDVLGSNGTLVQQLTISNPEEWPNQELGDAYERMRELHAAAARNSTTIRQDPVVSVGPPLAGGSDMPYVRRGPQRSAHRWILAAVAAVAVAGVSLAGLVISSGILGGRWTSGELTSVFAGLTAIISLAISALALRMKSQGESPSNEALLEDAANALARVVWRQQRQEILRWIGQRPRPLDTKWKITGRDIAPPPSEVFGLGDVTDRGSVTELGAVLRRLPNRQLVILGPPGAGKSFAVHLLALDLLEDRGSGGVVPVTFAVSAWRPLDEPLGAWLTQQLSSSYPLLSSAEYGPNAARQLIESGRVLPILDGLDEMSLSQLPAAIAALNKAMYGNGAIVLTSRTREYVTAVEANGSPVNHAVVVELEPIHPFDIADYLITGQTYHQQDRWSAVVQELRTHPSGSLAQAFSTPLALYLAVGAYASPQSDPTELLARSDLSTPQAIQVYLLNQYLSAAYEAAEVSAYVPVRTPHYSPQQARRWLGFLAAYLQRTNRRDLAWWQLFGKVESRWLTVNVLTSLILAFASGLIVAVNGGWRMGLLVGFVTGITATFAAQNRRAPVPLRLNRPSRRGRQSTVQGMVAGLGVGLAVGLLMGLSVGLEQALAMGLVLGVGMGVALGIGHGLVRPMSDRELVGPNATLREDRTSSFVSMLIIGLSVGISVGFVSGLLAGLVAGIATGLAIVLNSAWFRFTASTAWLSVRGLLPWQLMFFLEDSNRRGVLRQVGAVYQFRHDLLQDYLANSRLSESKARSSS